MPREANLTPVPKTSELVIPGIQEELVCAAVEPN
jgi:hypothetical protein